MFKQTDVLVELMGRMLDAGVLTSSSDFYGGNMQALPLNGKDFWIRERPSGFSLDHLTNTRIKQVRPQIVYDFCVPKGSGTNELDTRINALLACFDMSNDSTLQLAGNGYAGRIIKIRMSEDYVIDSWYCRSVSLYLSLYIY